MKLPNSFSTIGFKLSALYLVLFLCSFLSIGITVYWLTQQSLETQLKNTIETEANRLKTEFDADGITELRNEIAEVSDHDSHTLFEYGVIDQNGRLLAGTLDTFKLFDGWQLIMRPSDSKAPEKNNRYLYYIRVIALPNHLWLSVGHDGKLLQTAGDAVIKAFTGGFILVIFLGACGGFYISRTFLRKIESITKSTQTIIEGDLSHRLPVSNNHDELDNLALLLNLMLDKISSLIENIQQVSTDIAHDLRTPISHLKLRLENTLNKSISPKQYSEQLTFAIEELDSILATFSALLRISQIESGSRRSSFKSFNFSNIVIAVKEALLPIAEEQNKTIQLDIEKSLVLMGDKELLTQLIFNLLDNAIIHTPKKTQINMTLCSSRTHTELIITDNGPGIADAYHQKVFQRFYRLEQSRSTSGNGLGLSIVLAITELHEGTLTLADKKPGLKITVSIPTRTSHLIT